jgi:zinc protease
MCRRFLFALVLCSFALSACAPQLERVASLAAQREQPAWGFEQSDVPVDPAFRFGRLDNGMRYVIRQNATPKGTALVRMEVAAGSLDESEQEQGYAHFVEHMAFNGSTYVPEGEMVRLQASSPSRRKRSSGKRASSWQKCATATAGNCATSRTRWPS